MTATFISGLLLISMRANAEIKPGAHQVALSLGAANPMSYNNIDGERTEFGSLGPALGFSYLYQLLPHLGLGADFSAKGLGDRDFRSGRGPGEVSYSAWTLMGTVRGDLTPESNIRPYGLLGLGIGGVKRKVRYTNSPSFDYDRTSGGGAFALAGGVDFDLTDAWFAGAELRYNFIGADESDIGTNNVRTLDTSLKIGYKF